MSLRLVTALLATLLLATSARSMIIPPTLGWNAASAGGDPASTWDSDVGSQAWSVSGASHGSGVSTFPGIGAAYDFDGVGDRIFGGSFEDFRGGPATAQDVSFELWFRPLDLAGGSQVLFETGGEWTVSRSP
jgi:hypothetical protein